MRAITLFVTAVIAKENILQNKKYAPYVASPVVPAPVVAAPVVPAPVIAEPEYIIKDRKKGPVVDHKVIKHGKYRPLPATTVSFPAVVANPFIDNLSKPIVKLAKQTHPISVTSPVYSCPKPGFVLDGDYCHSMITAPSRIDCPPGSILRGPDCIASQPRIEFCPQGELIDGKCFTYQYSEPIAVCPPGSIPRSDGKCESYELVQTVEVCPKGTHRKENGVCVSISYAPADLICPPNYLLAKDRCVNEVIGYKSSKNFRRLDENIFVEDNLDYYTYPSSEPEEKDPAMQCQDEKCLSHYKYDYYYPVTSIIPEVPFEQPVYQVGPTYPVDNQWKRLAVPVIEAVDEYIIDPTMEVTVDSPIVDGVAIPVVPNGAIVAGKPQKLVTEKERKQVVKIISQAAERVCPIGLLRNNKCYIETEVLPENRCPASIFEGNCATKKILRPVAQCSRPEEVLICPRNRLDSKLCKCESAIVTPTATICPDNFVPSGPNCVFSLSPLLLCPIGFNLSPQDSGICEKHEIEPAFCTFTVTHLCENCDINSFNSAVRAALIAKI